jgi:hypothetical protein
MRSGELARIPQVPHLVLSITGHLYAIHQPFDPASIPNREAKCAVLALLHA